MRKKEVFSKFQNKKLHYLEGKFEIAKSGVGFVINKNNPTKDILIYPENFKKALHGDLVLAAYYDDNSNNKKIKGSIYKIIKRNELEFIGRLTCRNNRYYVIPFSNSNLPDFLIKNIDKGKMILNEYVKIKFLSWENHSKYPVGEILNYYQNLNFNDLVYETILTHNKFTKDFSSDIIPELAKLPTSIPLTEIKKRKDFRAITTFTIDPVDAKDFDDAISFKNIKNDIYEIGIHIADVSHFVEENTELDKSAFLRGTSVYLPTQVVPMLPEKISNELCSLRPNEDKLCFAVILEINQNGEILNSRIEKTIINSVHRFNYEDAQNILDTKKGPYSNELLILNSIAQKIRNERIKNGAINFNSQEIKFQLDEKGNPTNFVLIKYSESHQLIEEYMLLANKIVAEFIQKEMLKNNNLLFPFRIHDQPDIEKLTLFINFAKKYNINFDTSTMDKIVQSFNTMLNKIEGKPEQFILQQMGIRTMAKAIYSTKNIGHYGLGFTNYCHFTSPIRRYPDLIAHRILFALLNKEKVIQNNLDHVCTHCSEREKSATNAERDANKYIQVKFMEPLIGQTFEAIISGINGNGCWVETMEQKAEGYFMIQQLKHIDSFVFNQSNYSLVGKNTNLLFTIGDLVSVKLIDANLDTRQLDFEIILPKEINIKQNNNI